MEVVISYDQNQLEAAVKYIAAHQRWAWGDEAFVRKKILEAMYEIARTPDRWMQSSGGYLVMCEKEFEGIDSDENTARFEIWVDPSLGIEEYTIKEEVIHT